MTHYVLYTTVGNLYEANTCTIAISAKRPIYILVLLFLLLTQKSRKA